MCLKLCNSFGAWLTNIMPCWLVFRLTACVWSAQKTEKVVIYKKNKQKINKLNDENE